jgi:predicted DNA-binding ribbon-helix-helix protein
MKSCYAISLCFYPFSDFITFNYRSVFHVSNPQLNKELQDALRDLGSGADKAGNLGGVLRVMCSYPAKPHMQTIKQIAEADKCNYVATVDMKRLAEHRADQEVIRSLELRLAAASMQRKRKSGREEVPKRSTRRKIEVSHFNP